LNVPEHFHTYFPRLEMLWFLSDQLNKISRTFFNLSYLNLCNVNKM
jgi:hypothetical protein